MKLKYGILAGTRSGSSYLCELLTSTGRAGYPTEYLNPDEEHYFKTYFNYKNDRTLINHIIGKAQTDNEVFGGKFIVDTKNKERNHLYQLIYNGYNDLSDWKWIHLQRENIILQAISRYKANITKQWEYSNKEKIKIEYNYDKITSYLEDIKNEQLYIKNFLKDRNHLLINYESDLLEEPEQTITSILNFLDVGIDEIPELKSTLTIQRDEQSLEWEKKYNNDRNKK